MLQSENRFPGIAQERILSQRIRFRLLKPIRWISRSIRYFNRIRFNWFTLDVSTLMDLTLSQIVNLLVIFYQLTAVFYKDFTSPPLIDGTAAVLCTFRLTPDASCIRIISNRQLNI